MANGYQAELPRNLEAEQAVLGSALYDVQYVPKIQARLKKDDFYFLSHQHIFEAIVHLQMNGQPVDVLTVASELASRNLLESVGGRVYVTELPDKVPVYRNYDHYISLVREHAMMRRLIHALNDIIGKAYKSEATANQLIDLTAKRIYDIRENRVDSSFEVLGDILVRKINELQLQSEGKVEKRVRTHFPRLDSMLEGLRPGAFYVLASRPGVGKTSFALNIAHNAVRHGHTTAIFSLEMSKEEIGTRVLVAESKVPGTTLERITPKHEDAWTRIADALNDLLPVPLYIDDRSGATVVEMQAKCKQLQLEQGGLDLVIVDYLQLMSGSGREGGRSENRQQEISDISRMLKLMARELGVPVIALSQLSRAGTQSKRRPMLSDLRESGAIEQDADVVMFLYPLEASEDKEEAPDPINTVDLIVEKNRHGERGTITLGWNAPLTQFYEPSFLEAPPE
ncbi:MAG TPA: replicative DNA helicase [Fastidiosipila sp.]|nr:replicative DNA helicase [Fastidiosipila sp.]